MLTNAHELVLVLLQQNERPPVFCPEEEPTVLRVVDNVPELSGGRNQEDKN